MHYSIKDMKRELGHGPSSVSLLNIILWLEREVVDSEKEKAILRQCDKDFYEYMRLPFPKNLEKRVSIELRVAKILKKYPKK